MLCVNVNTWISRIYKKASAKTPDWCGILQTFAKVANMTNSKSKINLGAFSHVLKIIWRSEKKLGRYRNLKSFSK